MHLNETYDDIVTLFFVCASSASSQRSRETLFLHSSGPLLLRNKNTHTHTPPGTSRTYYQWLGKCSYRVGVGGKRQDGNECLPVVGAGQW